MLKTSPQPKPRRHIAEETAKWAREISSADRTSRDWEVLIDMIGKKVRNPEKSASKRCASVSLADYIRAPETENKPAEKCIYFGARGFFANDGPDDRSPR